MIEEEIVTLERPLQELADPRALGLAAFAVTIFMLSVHNVGWAPDLVWIGLAVFFGGLVQLITGAWDFKRGSTFGATVFGSYGAFWLSLAFYVLLIVNGKVALTDVSSGLGWFLLTFAILNVYLTLGSLRINVAAFLFFLILEVTEILLALGFLGYGSELVRIGGYAGILTALIAFYISASAVLNSVGMRCLLPVGRPILSD